MPEWRHALRHRRRLRLPRQSPRRASCRAAATTSYAWSAARPRHPTSRAGTRTPADLDDRRDRGGRRGGQRRRLGSARKPPLGEVPEHSARQPGSRPPVAREAIAPARRKPAFVAQNASAWYGDHGAEVVTEQSDSRGDSFMTRVAREWQDATEPAARAGARVCMLRTVPVHGPKVADLQGADPGVPTGTRRPTRRRDSVLPGDLPARLGRGVVPPRRARVRVGAVQPVQPRAADQP